MSIALYVQVEKHRLAAVQCAQVLDGVFFEFYISHISLPFSPSAGVLIGLLFPVLSGASVFTNFP